MKELEKAMAATSTTFLPTSTPVEIPLSNKEGQNKNPEGSEHGDDIVEISSSEK